MDETISHDTLLQNSTEDPVRMNAVILAAGFGTRLYPLTQSRPKALLRIGNKTILDHLVEKLEVSPVIGEIVLVTNGLFYIDFFRWRKEAPYRKPIRIEENKAYHPEKRLGAVRDLELGIKASRHPVDGFVILLGDNYFDFPLAHFINLYCAGHRDTAFVGLYDVKDPVLASRYGVVEVDEHTKIVGFEEKPSIPKSTRVSIGAYYLPARFGLRLFEYLEIEKLGPDRIGDFFAWLSQKEPLYGVDFDGAWFDIGTLESYEEAQKYIHAKTRL